MMPGKLMASQQEVTMDFAQISAVVLADNEYTWKLARHVGVSSPDSLNSPGAAFLCKIRDHILDESERILTAEYPEDEVSEIADSAAEIVSTYETWQIFTELELYNWDSGLYGDEETVKRGDITQFAQSVLWEVASDLANIIYSELVSALEAANEAAEDDDNHEYIVSLLQQSFDE
jgi:hypothetical protein